MVVLSCGCGGAGLFYIAGEHVRLQSACDWHLLRPFRPIATSGGWIASTGLSFSGAGRGLLVFLCSIVIEPSGSCLHNRERSFPWTFWTALALPSGCGCSRLAFSRPFGGFPLAGSFLQLLAVPWFPALGIWIETDRN